jgi:hypothetical protein
MVGNECRKYAAGLLQEIRGSNISEHDMHLNVSMGTAPYTPMRVSLELPFKNLIQNSTEEWLDSMVNGIGWTTSLTSGSIVFFLLSFGSLLAAGMIYHTHQITRLEEKIDKLQEKFTLLESGELVGFRKSASSYSDDRSDAESEVSALTESPHVPYRPLKGY